MKRAIILVVILVVLVNVVSADFFDIVNFSLSPFNASVTIAPPNNPPQLGQVNPEYFVCEGDRPNLMFNATDIDGDELDFDFPGLALTTPFFFDQFQFPTIPLPGGGSFREVLLSIDVALNKTHIGRYEIIIEVRDNYTQPQSDRNFTNISVIEINNIPKLEPFAQFNMTLNDTNREFYLELNVSDVEDGNRTDGNLSFNATFLEGTEIFNVSEDGIINFTIQESDVGEYEVLICATDLALAPLLIHPNISECGGIDVVTNQSDCEQFNINIKNEIVIVTPSSGGGGGGGGASNQLCQIKWLCIPWNECKRAEDALGQGILSGFQYRNIKSGCENAGIADEDCGYHTRECRDAGFCNRTIEGPPELEYCEYSIDASCFDGIKNCHDGGCEFLVDCGGGVCDLCPTCGDGIQNQGEHGIDCGGPCPRICSEESPLGAKISSLLESNILTIGFVVFASFVVVLIVVLIKKYYKVRDLSEEI